MTQEQYFMQEAMVDAIVENAEKTISVLKNGAGKSATCPSHEPMAKGVVCIAEMLIPVYKHVASQKPVIEESYIKTKWLTAGGKAMVPVCVAICVISICYTAIQIWGNK